MPYPLLVLVEFVSLLLQRLKIEVCDNYKVYLKRTRIALSCSLTRLGRLRSSLPPLPNNLSKKPPMAGRLRPSLSDSLAGGRSMKGVVFGSAAQRTHRNPE